MQAISKKKQKDKSYCKLTYHHIFRCQLLRCGFDPDRINWQDVEERKRAIECLKTLFTEEEWRKWGRYSCKGFYKTEEDRRRYRKNREIFQKIKKLRVYGGNKKLSWVQIYELIHGLAQWKGSANGKVGIRTFMGQTAYKNRLRRYGLSREIILSMTLEDLKNHITEKKLEFYFGKDWKEVLYRVWRSAMYKGTPAERLLHDLEIKKKHWIGRPFEYFIDLIKSEIWAMECGRIGRRKKYKEGFRKPREGRSMRFAKDWLQVKEVFTTCGLRHALLTMSTSLYKMLRKRLGAIRNITEEDFAKFLEVRIARMRRKKVSTQNTSVP